MVDIKAALNKARNTGRNATPRGRAIVEVHSFNENDNTATGKILNGIGAGEMITFNLSGKLTAKDYTKKGRTQVQLFGGDKRGGTLQVEGLSKKDGKDVYDTRWVKTFQPKPEDGQNMHLGKTCTLSVYKKGKSGAANLNILNTESEVFAKNVGEMRQAMIDAINQTGALAIMTVLEDGESYIRNEYAKSVKLEDGSYTRETGESWMERFDADLAGADMSFDAIFSGALESKGVSIVPVTSLRVGTGTWEAVEEKINEGKRGGSVDPEHFKIASLSMRFAAAYRALDVEADRDAVTKSFLASANEDAKARFHQSGFGAVEPRDIEKFLSESGVSVMKTPDRNGYVYGGILTMPYDKENPENGEMVTKFFNVNAAAPFPPVKVFEDIRKEYYEEMKAAVQSIAENALDGVKNSSDGGKPKAEASTEAAAPAVDETPIADDDIDDLLGDIANEGIDP